MEGLKPKECGISFPPEEIILAEFYLEYDHGDRLQCKLK